MSVQPEIFLGVGGPTESHDGELVKTKLQHQKSQDIAVHAATSPRKDVHESVNNLHDQESCKSNLVQVRIPEFS
jgi:hypothetical protein